MRKGRDCGRAGLAVSLSAWAAFPVAAAGAALLSLCGVRLQPFAQAVAAPTPWAYPCLVWLATIVFGEGLRGALRRGESEDNAGTVLYFAMHAVVAALGGAAFASSSLAALAR